MDMTIRVAEFRKLIHSFLTDRLNAKINKLSEGDPEVRKWQTKLEPSTWLEDASNRASQLQIVTHVLKATNANAKGTSLYWSEGFSKLDVVGTHSLSTIRNDVVGNAGALDVYEFLMLELGGKTLLDWMQDGDIDLLMALSNQREQAEKWISAFLKIKEPKDQACSHTLAKQIYWLAGDDPANDDQYDLLAPLYASSFAHQISLVISEHAFGDDAKLAKEAKKHGHYSELPVCDYPHLAVQKLGGTQPQNISKLNYERRGENCLLSSQPPVWKLKARPPFGDSLFDCFARRTEAKASIRDLKSFLESDPPNNLPTREKRDKLLNELFAELDQYIAELKRLEPGWSRDRSCRLSDDEKIWLDPGRAALDAEFAKVASKRLWIEEIPQTFASWINKVLGGRLPLGDAEHIFWADMFDDERWRSQSNTDQKNMEAVSNA